MFVNKKKNLYNIIIVFIFLSKCYCHKIYFIVLVWFILYYNQIVLKNIIFALCTVWLYFAFINYYIILIIINYYIYSYNKIKYYIIKSNCNRYFRVFNIAQWMKCEPVILPLEYAFKLVSVKCSNLDDKFSSSKSNTKINK